MESHDDPRSERLLHKMSKYLEVGESHDQLEYERIWRIKKDVEYMDNRKRDKKAS